MIKSAYTARELAELQLMGWPQTERGYQVIANRDNWQSQPRSARGGGREFPFATLPADLKKAILDQDTQGAAAMVNPLAGIKEATSGIGAEDRRTAKLTIVALFRQFHRVMGLGVSQAEEPFQAHYRQLVAKTPADMPFCVYPDFSLPSLRRWRAMADENPKQLGGQYGNRKGTGTLNRAADGEVGKYIAALLCENRHYKAGHIRDLVRAKFGDMLDVAGKQAALPSIRTFEMHIAQWKEDNAAVFMAITAPGDYRNKLRVATGKASADITALNEYWEIDATPADALCVDSRYNIYAIIDVWSRRALFSVSKTAKTEASLQLVRRAIMEWGVPQRLKTDNGSDFISYRFKTALLGLGIDQEVSLPFSPDKKPYVERVIKTLQHDFMAILPGFGGHSVADRQRIRDQKDFAARLGEKDDRTFQVELH